MKKKLYIYEPEKELVNEYKNSKQNNFTKFKKLLEVLKNNRIDVQIYNMDDNPMAFVSNSQINSFINQSGVEYLPATVVDDKICLYGRYPNVSDISKYMGIPKSLLINEKPNMILGSKPKKTCGCKCGN